MSDFREGQKYVNALNTIVEIIAVDEFAGIEIIAYRNEGGYVHLREANEANHWKLIEDADG